MSSQSPLTAITGIGDATAAALDGQGITNVQELAEAFDNGSDAVEVIPANYREQARNEAHSLRQAAEGNDGSEVEASVVEDRPEFLFTGETADKAAHQSLIFGDFDGDGTVNIDDIDPLNNAEDERFYGEVSMASEIDALQTITKNHREVYRDILNNTNEEFIGRVKQPVSVIRKLRENYFGMMKDVVATTIYADDHAHILDIVEEFRDKHRIIDEDDYIRNPLNASYFAYHVNFVYDASHLDLDNLSYPFTPEATADDSPLNEPRTITIGDDEIELDAGELSVEVQIKTKEEKEKVHEVTHEAYKNNEDMEDYAPLVAKYARKYAAEGITDWMAPLRDYGIDPDDVEWFEESLDVTASPDHPETTHEEDDEHPLEEDPSVFDDPNDDVSRDEDSVSVFQGLDVGDSVVWDGQGSPLEVTGTTDFGNKELSDGGQLEYVPHNLSGYVQYFDADGNGERISGLATQSAGSSTSHSKGYGGYGE